VWLRLLPVVSNLPRIPIPLMNTFFPFFPFFPALIRLISADGTNAAFGAYEHVFPFFPALIVRLISALMGCICAFMITIYALLDIESVDRYKLLCLLLCFGGCKHILGTTLLQF